MVFLGCLSKSAIVVSSLGDLLVFLVALLNECIKFVDSLPAIIIGVFGGFHHSLRSLRISIYVGECILYNLTTRTLGPDQLFRANKLIKKLQLRGLYYYT